MKVERLGPVAFCGDWAAYIGPHGTGDLPNLVLKVRCPTGTLTQGVPLDGCTSEEAVAVLMKGAVGEDKTGARLALDAAIRFYQAPPVGTN